jgi:hypothetical protein
MWSSDDRASMWKADSTQLVWAAAAFAQLQYEDRIITTGARAGSTLTLSAAVQGDPWKIEYRENSTKSMWSADASSADVERELGDADVGRADLPHLARLDRRVPGLDVRLAHHRRPGADAGKDHRPHRDARCARHRETLANVAISSGGTRLAPAKSYGTVKSVHLTVVADGGTAVSGKQEDTQATGPLVKTYDGTGVAVNGHVNARIEGY